MQEYFKAAILGIVQGITEFLPISSTAHLRIFPALMRWEDPGTAYSAVIQLGSMLAVIIYFWSDLIRIYGALLGDFLLWVKGKVSSPLQSHDSKLGFWILIGTIPICVFGVLFKEPIEKGVVGDLNIISFYILNHYDAVGVVVPVSLGNSVLGTGFVVLSGRTGTLVYNRFRPSNKSRASL